MRCLAPDFKNYIFWNRLAISKNLTLKKMMGIFFRLHGSSGPMCLADCVASYHMVEGGGVRCLVFRLFASLALFSQVIKEFFAGSSLSKLFGLESLPIMGSCGQSGNYFSLL